MTYFKQCIPDMSQDSYDWLQDRQLVLNSLQRVFPTPSHTFMTLCTFKNRDNFTFLPVLEACILC
jgi:hypothetical protein